VSTAIEKKSLEAHVELCAERYDALEDKLDNLDRRIDKIGTNVEEIKTAIAKNSIGASSQIIKIGTALFCVLLASCIGLVANLVMSN
jgi:prefoldin subunit 5|tara:strand:+ start:1778 stop:2038 length:261 start_codon:yes stop_codon:yes gene_type:complete